MSLRSVHWLVPFLTLALGCGGDDEAASAQGGSGGSGLDASRVDSNGIGAGGSPSTPDTATSGQGGGLGPMSPTDSSTLETSDARPDGSGALANADGATDGPAATDGCGHDPSQELAKYVAHHIQSQNEDREYFIYLPKTYDKSRAYPTVFLWHGCGGRGDGALPLERASKEDAILIAPTANTTTQNFGTCFDNKKDLELFDHLLKETSSKLCMDQKRLFSAGFSSGSWMTNYLGCKRSSVLRAQANISGGLSADPNSCEKDRIAGLFIHDQDDMTNKIAGGQGARDRLLSLDTCASETKAWDPSPCQQYQGCAAGYPVVWCVTSGQGHAREDSLSVPAIWKFFSQF